LCGSKEGGGREGNERIREGREGGGGGGGAGGGGGGRVGGWEGGRR
jgi:hypothetical protein